MVIKRIIFIVAVIMLAACEPEYVKKNKKYLDNNPDRDLLIDLISIDKKAYIGGTVDSFLKNKQVKKNVSYHFSSEDRIGILDYLLIYFGDKQKVYMLLYPNKLKYVEKENTNLDWDIEEFKKETIKDIKICYVDSTKGNKEVQLEW